MQFNNVDRHHTLKNVKMEYLVLFNNIFFYLLGLHTGAAPDNVPFVHFLLAGADSVYPVEQE